MIHLGTERSIPAILEEYAETLPLLWGRRCADLRSENVFPGAFADLEERIAAHTDGLVLAGEDALPLLKPGLAGDEGSVSLASAYALLRMGDEAAARLVADAAAGAAGECLRGLCLALSYGPVDLVGPRLREIAADGPPLAASAAAEALAFHGDAAPAARRIAEFLASGEAAVRRAAWRIVALSEGSGGPPPGWPESIEDYGGALRDSDPSVRRQALEAAAWTRQPWLLDHCRDRCAAPSADDLDAIALLAVLGEPSDLGRLLEAGRGRSLGPARFRALGAFGHPGVVDLLLEGIASDDVATSVASAAAYTRITGADVDSGTRSKVAPVDGPPPDEFEAEFLEEVALPDAERAAAHWAAVRETFRRGTRWCRGNDVSGAGLPGASASVDNASRWEAALRSRFRGAFPGRLADSERFPLV